MKKFLISLAIGLGLFSVGGINVNASSKYMARTVRLHRFYPSRIYSQAFSRNTYRINKGSHIYERTHWHLGRDGYDIHVYGKNGWYYGPWWHKYGYYFRNNSNNHIHLFKEKNNKLDNPSRTKAKLYYQLIHDINNDRHKHSLSPLKISRTLSQIANIRSKQLTHNFSHNIKGHPYEIRYLLAQKNVFYHNYGENIIASPLGKIGMADSGLYDNPYDYKPRIIKYNAKNGTQLANNINNALMYHDGNNHNNDRNNYLNRHFHKIGVGITYNYRDKNFYIAIEFI